MRYRYPDEIYSYRDVGGFFDDVVEAGKGLVPSAIDDAFKKLTPAQQAATEKVLSQVEARARAGVIAEVKANAIPLGILAFSLGAVGGFVLKGKVGLAVAIGLAGYAAYTLGSKATTKSTAK